MTQKKTGYRRYLTFILAAFIIAVITLFTFSTNTLIPIGEVAAVAVGALAYILHERSIKKLRKQTAKKKTPDER